MLGCSSGRAAAANDVANVADVAEVRRNDCALRAQDSVYAASGIVYRDCAVDVRARLLTRISPDYRPAGVGCVSAAIEFVVGTDGVPDARTARIVRSNDAVYAESVMQTIPRVRYEPARRDGANVQQIVLYPAMISSQVIRVSAGGPPPSRGTLPRPQRC